MANDTGVTDSSSEKKQSSSDLKNQLCKICCRKVVNGVTCSQCSEKIHYKCANIQDISVVDVSDWMCRVCINNISLDDTLCENDDDNSSVEEKYMKREILLLRKLVREMEEKNTLLSEKIKFLESENICNCKVMNTEDGCTRQNVIDEPARSSQEVLPSTVGTTFKNVISLQEPASTHAGNSNKNEEVPLVQQTKDLVYDIATYVNKNNSPQVVELTTPSNVSSKKENTGKNNEEGFQTVQYKKRTKQKIPSVIGTSKLESTLSAVSKKAWFYVGRLNVNTSEDDVKNYLKSKINNEEFHSTKISTQGASASFKIGASFHLREQLEDPEFWPEGVMIRQFIFFRKRASLPAQK